MNELRITQDKGPLYRLPTLAFSVFSFFTLTIYLATGLSALTCVALISTVMTTAWVGWEAYIACHRYVLINKSRRQITIMSMNVFGTQRIQLFSVGHFKAVRSYIIAGSSSRNMVELVTNSGKRGLVLSSFPTGGKQSWSLAVGTENPHATNLANAVSAFIPVQNLGFVGQRLETVSVENHEGSFFSRIF